MPTNLLVCTGSPREIVLERPGTPIFSPIRAQSCTNAKSSRLPGPVGLPALPRAKTVHRMHKNAQTGVRFFAPPSRLSPTLTPTNPEHLSTIGLGRNLRPIAFLPRPHPKIVHKVHKNAQTVGRFLAPPSRLGPPITPTNRGHLSRLGFVSRISVQPARPKTVHKMHKNAQTAGRFFARASRLGLPITPTNRGHLSRLGFVSQISVQPAPRLAIPPKSYNNRNNSLPLNPNWPLPGITEVEERQVPTHSLALSVFIRVHPWPFSANIEDDRWSRRGKFPPQLSNRARISSVDSACSCLTAPAAMDARQPIRFIMPLARSRPSARELGRRLCDV